MDDARLEAVFNQAHGIVSALTSGAATVTRVLEIGEVEGAIPGLGVCILVSKEVYENRSLMAAMTQAIEELDGVTNVLIEFPRDG